LHGPFAPCEDVTEVMLVVHKLGGMRAVEFVLDKSKMSKETLREAADRLKRVGLVDLAQLLRQHARRAKPRPPSFKERMRLGFHQRIAAKDR
jgi:RNA polymerase-interacting CarD/CdnL/TRCF family regulator